MRPASSEIIEFEFGHAKVREHVLNISIYAFLYAFTQGCAYPTSHILVFNFLHVINHGKVSPLVIFATFAYCFTVRILGPV